jgi:hypothetical protein
MKQQSAKHKKGMEPMLKKQSHSKPKIETVKTLQSWHIILVGILFVAIFATFGVRQLRPSDAATSTSSNINTQDRNQVNSYYKSLWAANTKVRAGWSGSVKSCKPGNPSAAARTAQINAVNFARRMSQLTPISGTSLTDTNQANVQRAALMMEANGSLSHAPSSKWKCYASAGATAASKANFGISYATGKPVSIIASYLTDKGDRLDNNYAVGHRRWLLNPAASEFAFGTTTNASVMQVIGLKTNSANNNPAYVAWPSSGYFPNTIEPAGRWSLSGRSTACFNNAQVSVQNGSKSIKISLLSRAVRSYGNPTIVWQMPSSLNKTGTYKVQVSNINQWTGSACSTSSSTNTSYTYSVNLFRPY